MKDSQIDPVRKRPLLYYRSKEEIESYRRKPVEIKLRLLEAQMEFYHEAMPDKAKKIRDKFLAGEI